MSTELSVTMFLPVEGDIVAEVWAGDEMWGEVHEHDGPFTVTCWPNRLATDGRWTFDLDRLVSISQRARMRLAGPDTGAPSLGEQP